MLDINYIRKNKEKIIENCKIRNVKVDIEKILSLDEERRSNIKQIEELRAFRKQNSKGKPTEEQILKLREVGDKVKVLEDNQAKTEAEYLNLLMQVPNLTHPDAPIGGEEDFKVIFESETKPKLFPFQPKDHEQLMTDLDLIDFERGAKVAESKFYFFKNDAVRLNQAMINYGIDVVTKYGYTLMETPDLAKDAILLGTGYNPRGNETQIYSIENTDLSLVGTAEITVGGYHAEEILDLSKGPKKYVALSHCFRTESGSYGRTSKGLYRVHQFTKLEMFVFCKPEDSEKLHQEIVKIEREILQGLGVPFRTIDIPSGDLGGPAYRKFDNEAWMIMKGDGKEKQGDYSEVTSCSNCLDYQARRLNIKYRKEDNSTEFVHTLNGSAIVLSRFPIIIAENFQNEDGSITVPEVLRKYVGKEVITLEHISA